ncbi:MAG TPA: hypothetical protein VKX17_02240 [Planctomycetota bacterium]|nr:hypothetical protein [Planctomycetota bacterium]
MNRPAFMLAPIAAILLVATTARAEQIESGLYLRTLYAFGNLSINTLYFGPGNKIAIDPAHGVHPIDFDAEAKDNPKNVGTYTLAGAKVNVSWGGGKPAQTLSVEFSGGKLSAFDGGLVSKAEAFPKDHKLTGQFAWGATTANASSSRTIIFAAAGTYSMTTLGGIHHVPGNNAATEKTETGSYALSGNTLTLSPANGTAVKHTVIPMNTALDPAKAKLGDEHIIFDGINMRREK